MNQSFHALLILGTLVKLSQPDGQAPSAEAAARNRAARENIQVVAKPALPQGVAPCESCHGARGEGNPALGAPRIASQAPAYLERQLTAFANGSRNNPTMAPIAKKLDAGLRSNLAAYYASLDAPRPVAGKAAKSLERGRLLATRGDGNLGIQACANCHGADDNGGSSGNPYIAGQHGPYLAATLRAWRDGRRNTDPSGQMPAIAKRLSDRDIAALAEYYASATPPAPNAFRAAQGPAKSPPQGMAGRSGSEAANKAR